MSRVRAPSPALSIFEVSVVREFASNADVAQLVEHTLGKGEVTGSIPVVSSERLDAEFRAEARSAEVRNDQRLDAEFRAEARSAEVRNDQRLDAEFPAEARS